MSVGDLSTILWRFFRREIGSSLALVMGPSGSGVWQMEHVRESLDSMGKSVVVLRWDLCCPRGTRIGSSHLRLVTAPSRCGTWQAKIPKGPSEMLFEIILALLPEGGRSIVSLHLFW